MTANKNNGIVNADSTVTLPLILVFESDADALSRSDMDGFLFICVLAVFLSFYFCSNFGVSICGEQTVSG